MFIYECIECSVKKKTSVGIREIVYVPCTVALHADEAEDCHLDDDHFCR